MRFVASAVALIASAMLAGCAGQSGGMPFLTPKVFARAAAKCGVVTTHVSRRRKGRIPYASYKILGPAGEVRSDDGKSRACLTDALRGYRYDYLGEQFPDT